MKYYLILFLFNSWFLFSQEIIISVGENFTKYDYYNSLGEKNIDFSRGRGVSYNLGYYKSLENCRCNFESFSFSGALSLDNYNALINSSNSVIYKTEYVGLSLTGYNSLRRTRYTDFQIKYGGHFQKLIEGEQFIGPKGYNLKNYTEFNGNWIAPFIGAQVKLKTELIHFYVGWNISKHFNLTNKGTENLRFINNSFSFGVSIPLKEQYCDYCNY
jgi:hypothetical protein